ncbi:hypothetical protein [Streptomyces spectabilis]|nr:hypothetical protein [Streptomyces spectabilis]
MGAILRPGRTLTVCRLEVFGVRGGQRTLGATGRRALIRVEERPER